jgi:hypothetical protein
MNEHLEARLIARRDEEHSAELDRELLKELIGLKGVRLPEIEARFRQAVFIWAEAMARVQPSEGSDLSPSQKSKLAGVFAEMFFLGARYSRKTNRKLFMEELDGRKQ